MRQLTKTMRETLAEVHRRRPVAGNDDDWKSAHGLRRPTINALRVLGLLEPSRKGPGTWGDLMFRLTPAGRTALSGGP